MNNYKSNFSSIKKVSLNRFEDVFLEVSDLLWESNGKYIYTCRILNPSESFPMREGGYIALHSNSILLKKMQLQTSIEIVNNSKYKATYSLVNNSYNHLGSSTEALSEEDYLVEAEELANHQVENEAVAEDYGMSVDEYHEVLEAEYNDY